MSTRHIARTIALQTLFELDIKGLLSDASEDVDAIILRNTEEFGEGIKDITFTKDIVVNAISRRITIDDIITRAAPDWPLEKIDNMARTILRLGIYELLFGEELGTPKKVAINEAIEMAKAYGGDGAKRFINGVLATVYKELENTSSTEVK
jgi:N utilization substance protein B